MGDDNGLGDDEVKKPIDRRCRIFGGFVADRGRLLESLIRGDRFDKADGVACPAVEGRGEIAGGMRMGSDVPGTVEDLAILGGLIGLCGDRLGIGGGSGIGIVSSEEVRVDEEEVLRSECRLLSLPVRGGVVAGESVIGEDWSSLSANIGETGGRKGKEGIGLWRVFRESPSEGSGGGVFNDWTLLRCQKEGLLDKGFVGRTSSSASTISLSPSFPFPLRFAMFVSSPISEILLRAL